jgi:hypothetical protein
VLVGNQLKSPVIDWDNVAPEQAKLPEIADMLSMPDNQLRATLQRFGIVESWPQMRAAAAAYVQRMSNIPVGSPAFKAEIERLVSSETKRGLLSMARRAYREYSAVYAMDGNPDTVFVRVPEGDDSTCDRCIGLGGEEGTMAYHK